MFMVIPQSEIMDHYSKIGKVAEIINQMLEAKNIKSLTNYFDKNDSNKIKMTPKPVSSNTKAQ